MQIRLVALELSTAHLAECDTRTMVRVDIRGNLEDKTRELLLLGFHLTLLSLRRTGTGGYLHETVQQLLHTEIIQGRAKEHRRHLGRTVGFHLKLGIDTINQFKVLTQLCRIVLSHPVVKVGTVDINLHLIRHTLFIRRKEVELLFIDVIHTLELRPLVDGPGQRTDLDLEFLFQFIEQVKGVATFTVHLIDKDDHRRLTHTTDRHQLTRLRLHTLGPIDHDDGRVNGCQRSEGILGKVLVTRSIEDVDFVFDVFTIRCIVKFHYRG